MGLKGGAMLQAKFSVDKKQVSFLNNFKQYGFRDKSSMLREAIDHFKRVKDLEHLKASADLYAEAYREDDELKELTEAATDGWPE
jgi:hypothetical protein